MPKNLRPHLDRVRALDHIARQPVPYDFGMLHLVMGRQCNVRCEFCYQTSFKPSDDISDDVVRDRVIPFVADARRMIIQGGDPTVMKNCKRLRDHLRGIEYRGDLCILTNGVLFDGEWLDFMLGRRAPGEVHFSINASCQRVYDEVVKYGDWDRALANMGEIIRRRADRNEPRATVSFVIYERNMWDVLEFYRFFRDFGVNGFAYYIDNRRPKNFWSQWSRESIRDWRSMIRQAISEMREGGFDTSELPTLDYLLSNALNEPCFSTLSGDIAGRMKQ